jgi:hypothetical protein
MKENRSTHPATFLIATSASVSSILAAALLGQRRSGRAAAAVNGPSQWLWGRTAKHRRRFSLRHTLVGYCIHHASSWLWASAFASRAARRLAPEELPRAAAITALAATVDYLVVPKRFTPGFEAHLGRGEIALVYAAFAAGLIIAQPLKNLRRPRRRA